MKLSLHMHNVLGQSNQMHSLLGVFVRFYLICLIKFSTKNIKTHVQTVIINTVIT